MSVVSVASLQPGVMRLLARGVDAPSVVPALHQAALELTPAVVSVLVRPDPVTGQWTAMSGAGVETLALGPWLTTRQASEAAGRALSGDEPLVLGSLAPVQGKAGPDSVKFKGKLKGKSGPLAPGKYTLRATATAGGVGSAAVTAGFEVLIP